MNDEFIKQLTLPITLVSHDKNNFIIIDQDDLEPEKLLICGQYLSKGIDFNKFAYHKILEFSRIFPTTVIYTDGNKINLNFINCYKFDLNNLDNCLIKFNLSSFKDANKTIQVTQCLQKNEKLLPIKLNSVKSNNILVEKLKVYSIISRNGTMLLTTLNEYGKILYVNLLNNKNGLCGIKSDDYYYKFFRIQEIWKELDTKVMISDKKTYFYINDLIDEKLKPGVYKFTKTKNGNIRFELKYN